MANRYQSAAVLLGGPGGEREVSLRSGRAVAEALRQSGLHVHELDVTDMAFQVPEDVEAVFPVLHGVFGEDGIAQRRLEELGLPYVGSRSWEMPKSFDKEITHALLAHSRIPMADWQVITSLSELTLSPPLVLKPPREGSSLGVEIVLTPSELKSAWDRTALYDTRILVESFIEGRECTVGFLGETPLPVVEIRPADGVYDYEAKYTRTDTQYLCPAPLSEADTERIQSLAQQAYRLLGGRHLGRVDFLLTNDGKAVVLELNPLPGFTETSLLPKAAAAAGLEFPEFCLQLLNMAEVVPSGRRD